MVGPEYLNSGLKRSLDLSVATGALGITSPLWLLVAKYNRMRGQPLIFKQERVGRLNIPFFVFKFETLYKGAELEPEHSSRLRARQNMRENGDPRVRGRAMAFMRQTGLNEIPQLLNVLNGQMSIVGPRPLPSEFIRDVEEMFPQVFCEWRETALTIKPGLVGTSPLISRRIPVNQYDMAARLDIKYYWGATFWKDLTVICEAISSITRNVK